MINSQTCQLWFCINTTCLPGHVINVSLTVLTIASVRFGGALMIRTSYHSYYRCTLTLRSDSLHSSLKRIFGNITRKVRTYISGDERNIGPDSNCRPASTAGQ